MAESVKLVICVYSDGDVTGCAAVLNHQIPAAINSNAPTPADTAIGATRDRLRRAHRRLD